MVGLSDDIRHKIIIIAGEKYPYARKDTVWHFLDSMPLSASYEQNMDELDYSASVHRWSEPTVAAMQYAINLMYDVRETCQKKITVKV